MPAIPSTNAVRSFRQLTKLAFNKFSSLQSNAALYGSLKEVDPEIFGLIEQEKERQFSGLELIASEVFFTFIINPAVNKFWAELHICCCDGS